MPPTCLAFPVTFRFKLWLLWYLDKQHMKCIQVELAREHLRNVQLKCQQARHYQSLSAGNSRPPPQNLDLLTTNYQIAQEHISNVWSNGECLKCLLWFVSLRYCQQCVIFIENSDQWKWHFWCWTKKTKSAGIFCLFVFVYGSKILKKKKLVALLTY